MAQLAECLSGYVTDLAHNRRIVTENQRSEIPVHSLSENIQLYCLPFADTTQSLHTALSSVVEEK